MHRRGVVAAAAVLALCACVPRPDPALLHGVSAPVQAQLEALRVTMGEAVLQPAHPRRIACLAEQLTVPGALSLAGLGAQAGTGVGEPSGRRAPVPEVLSYEQALQRLADSGRLPFDAEQGRAALEILRSGRWQADFADALASLLDLAQRAPASALGDVASLHALPEQLGVGILKDVRGALAYRKIATLTMLDEERRRVVPESGLSTLKVLSATGTARDVARTSSVLLENESVRLAVIVYAGSQGVEIDPADLDRVREVLDSDDPSLAPLVVPATETLVRRYGGAQGVALLEHMSKHPGVVACR